LYLKIKLNAFEWQKYYFKSDINTFPLEKFLPKGSKSATVRAYERKKISWKEDVKKLH